MTKVLPCKKCKGNPFFAIKCEECGYQILSWQNIGTASLFDKDEENPWKTGKTEIRRYVCVRCSNNLGYDEGE